MLWWGVCGLLWMAVRVGRRGWREWCSECWLLLWMPYGRRVLCLCAVNKVVVDVDACSCGRRTGIYVWFVSLFASISGV